MREVWMPVVGHEGSYEVSNLGRVRSVDRWLSRPGHVTDKGNRRSACICFYQGKLLRPGPSKSGHVSVAIGKNNSRLVHQLVMEAFTGPCPSGHEVLHLDHTPSNNRWRNLKYGTRSENIKADYAVGTRTTPVNFIGARWRA